MKAMMALLAVMMALPRGDDTKKAKAKVSKANSSEGRAKGTTTKKSKTKTAKPSAKDTEGSRRKTLKDSKGSMKTAKF